MQETHLQNSNEFPSDLKNYEHLYSIINNFADENDRSSGICMFINKTETLLEEQHIIIGRLSYVRLQNSANNEITNIFSYYGRSRNSRTEWANSFNEIRDKVQNNGLENIMVMGDFNFVTSVLDRNSQILNAIDQTATNSFIEIQEELNILDSFRLTNPKRRLYSYHHTDGKSKSRIDRIYVDVSLSGRAEATKLEHSQFSDHKIVRLRMGNNIERGPGSWIFNTSLLDDSNFCNRMITIFREAEIIKPSYASKKMFWDYLTMLIQSETVQYSVKKSQEKKSRLYKLNRDLEELEQIPSNLMSDFAAQRLQDVKRDLASLEKEKIDGMKLRTKIPNHDFGEPNISFLARLEKIQGEKNTIYSLKDENGILKTDTESMLDIVYNFYKKLYTKEEECVVQQDTFLRRITTRLSLEDREDLDRDLGEEELYESLKHLKKQKSPGIDGLNVEFTLHFWEYLKEHYMDATAEVKDTKELTEMEKRGMIRICYKKGNRDDLANHRPITLMPTGYKQRTHALAKRLTKVLPKLIHNCQKAVPGRCITDNIHTVQDLINLVNKNGDCAAFVFYDQEKAFDRMSHNFIIKTLQAYGFGTNFIEWVKIMLYDIKSFVKVNGFETSEFDIQRGVRQGCALSALLYVLVSEVLALEIRHNTRIKGYRFNENHFKMTQYADDLMTIVTDDNSLNEVFDVLERFGKATNARINQNKTEALWVGSWKNRIDKPLNLKWKKDYVKFLGVYVGNCTNSEESTRLSNVNFEDIDQKMTKKLNFWNGSGISIKGKVRVVNIFVLSKIFYRLECVDITKEMKKGIERKIRVFIWGDRVVGRIDFKALTKSYQKGGLKLVEIDTKVKTMRIQWLYKLTTKPVSDIERHLADNLIGEYRGIKGIDILNHTTETRLLRSINQFYSRAIEYWRALDIEFKVASLQSIRNITIYHNKLLVNSNNEVFNFFNLNNQQTIIPKLFKDLPVTRNLRGLSDVNKMLIREINRAYWLMYYNKLGHVTVNTYMLNLEGHRKDLNECSSKEIYWALLKISPINEIWRTKWDSILRYYTLDINDREWMSIWDTVHNKLLTYEIHSAIWEMLHLNFYCGYREKILNYGPGHCKLCGNEETGAHHIVVDCKVLIGCMDRFTTLLHNLRDMEMSRDELAFGIAGTDIQTLGRKDLIRNFITFIIRTVVFKNRHKNYGSIQSAINVLENKIRFKIRKVLREKYTIFKHKYTVPKYIETYLIDNILGSVQGNILDIYV